MAFDYHGAKNDLQAAQQVVNTSANAGINQQAMSLPARVAAGQLWQQPVGSILFLQQHERQAMRAVS